MTTIITKEKWKQVEALRLEIDPDTKQIYTYRKIGLELGIKESTIESHFKRIRHNKEDGLILDQRVEEPLTSEEIIAQEAENELEKRERKLSRDEIKRASHISIICDNLLLACQKVESKPIEKVKLPKSIRSSHTIPILDFSDTQCGTEISLAATGGLNYYNKDVLAKQMEALLKGIVSVSVKQLAGHPLLKIHMLGDNLEGFNIFPGQAYHMDMDVYEQFFFLAELMVKFLLELLQLYTKIEICCIPGNHGRIGKKGEAPYYLNWDMFWYKYMEKHMQNYKGITWNISDAWWMTDVTYETTSLLIHGDGIKSWSGIPFYGIQRADARYTKLLASNKKFYNIIEMGHFHTPAELPTPTGPILINGCFPGASMYALKDLNTSNRPLQRMLGIHKKHGMTWSFPIYLDY